MKRQGRQAESFAKAPDALHFAALFFGRAGAPIDEHAELLRDRWLKDASPPRELIRLSPEEAKAEPGKITDGLYSASLFGGASLFELHINKESEATPILEALKAVDARGDAPEGRLIVIAGDLSTRSKLRKAFEGAERATTLQFFERSAAEFESWARDKLHKEKVSLTPEAEMALMTRLLDDPALAASEIEKLVLFSLGRDEPISEDDIATLTHVEDQSSHFQMVDLALDGQVKPLSGQLPRIAEENSAIPLLIGLTNQLKRLSQAHGLAASGLSGPSIGGRMTPRIFDRQWPVFERRMRIWSPPRILTLLSRIQDADVSCRRAGAPQDAIVAKLLLDIAKLASTAR